MEKVLNATTPKQKLIDQLTLRPPEDESTAPAVLPADHPLLEKFQQALKAHLLKVNAELSDEIDALDFSINKLNKECEEVGSNLYDYQQEIERQKDTLDDYNNQLKETSEKRIKHEQNASQLKKEYDTLNYSYKDAKRVHNERLLELNHIQILENNIAKWTEEIENEVLAAKRIVSKDGQDQLAISQQKKQTDLILFNLDAEVRRGDIQLSNINEQILEQNQNLDLINRSISDANADLNALQNEHKRLLGAWSEVILTIKRRDRTLAALREDLRTEHQYHKVTQSNIDGAKKSAAKEMEQNEKLEAFKIRMTNDIESLKRQLEKENTESNKLTTNIDQMTNMMEQTESDLSNANIQGQIIENHLKSLRRILEKQTLQKVQLEEKTLELLQDQITTDQASHHRAKILRETQERRRQMEITMFGTEQQLSQVLFDLEKWKATVSHDKINIDKLTKEKDNKSIKVNAIINETNFVKNSINIKNKTFDMINKELVALIDSAGGHELDPNEMKLVALEKNIAELDAEITETQNIWLRMQGHIVSMSQRRSQQLNSIHLARKQLLIIEQKTLKIDAELEELKAQDKETTRKMKKLYNQLDKLSASLFEKKKYHENSEVECEFTHLLLVDKLKNEEMTMLNLQNDINNRSKEIEETKYLAMEKHREALSWETKWKMAMETKKYRDQEIAAASEIGIMKAEIHRMEVRLAQLRRAQEKLAQDMENCVMHREHIFDGANLRGKLPFSKTKSRFTILHRLNDMKNKYKQTHIEITAIERTLNELNVEKEQCMADIRSLNLATENERMQDSMLQNEIEQAILLKQENLENIVRIQYRAKRYRMILTGKMLPKCRNEVKLITDMDRQQEINNHLISVLDSLINEYPDQKMSIKRVLQTLKAYDDD